MKKLLFYYLFANITSILLTGCSPAYQDGGWAIPVIGIITTCIFAGLAWRDFRRGAWYRNHWNVKIYTDEFLPIWKSPYFTFTLIMIVCTIVAIIVMNGDK